VLVVVWASTIAAWIVYQRASGLGALEAVEEFVDRAGGSRWALLAFVAVYAVRPLVLFPASVLTIAGGFLFGPVVGIGATIVGANASAMVAYGMARSLGREQVGGTEGRALLTRWADRMRRQSFTTVMLMRLAFLPYDLVNYAAGLLRIRPGQFLLATAIGSLPGTVSFTLAGASMERLEDGPSGIDLRVLGASLLLFVVSVAIAKRVQAVESSRPSTGQAPSTV
jgi:uncharacterized membrane protein YdjX (TVP38/TMEM64 family)